MSTENKSASSLISPYLVSLLFLFIGSFRNSLLSHKIAKK